MIFTLHRYIFKELFRVFILTTLAMTLILSLGFLLKPIQDFGVSPEEILNLLGYLMPITLTFVLPMSALFAASMVYGRFAADRELDACRASGISLWTLVYPGLSLAILVAIANLILSFHVAPAFIQRSEKSVKANAEQILFRNLQRKGFYTLPKSTYKIYAEKADPQRKLLEGVIILDTKDADIQRMVLAQSAKVEIETHSDFNKVRIIALNAVRVDDFSSVEIGNTSVERQFDSLLADDIKFYKLDKLKSIRIDKMKHAPIYKMAMQVYWQFMTELVGQYLNQTFGSSSPQALLQDADGFRDYFLTAAGCHLGQRELTLELTAPIQLVEMDRVQNQKITRQSQRGFCRLDVNQSIPRLELDLENPSWDRGEGVKGFALRKFINNVEIPASVQEKLESRPILDLLAEVGTKNSPLVHPSKPLLEQVRQLQVELAEVNDEIDAELHSRLVMGLGCVSLILTGIALGVYYRGGHLLSAFGASAVPGGLLVVFIMSGKQITKNASTTAMMGITVMWLGLAILTLLTVYLYRRLLKT